MLQIGTLIEGKYKILEVIGQGGMSTVYLAINERAGKRWAIKEVRKDAETNFKIVKQSLIAETTLLKKLSHKSLPSIVDIVDQEECFLIVMDYIEGITLKQILEEKGTQKERDVIKWAKQLCSVLGYLHGCNPPIIYRDLKPGNIMLKPDGDIVLIDFGTARQYKNEQQVDTTCLGTLGYAAPEQFGGQGQTDARTDIYNLGATLYHLITGQNPGKPPYKLYPIRHWNQALSPGFEKIIAKCLMKDPQMRYGSVGEVLYDLEHYKEIDRSYKIKAVIKLAAFAATFFMACMSFFLTLSFCSKARQIEKNSYKEYLTRAAENTDEIGKLEEYIKAIYLDSKDGTAYVDLLENLILQDDVMTIIEDGYLKEILLMPDNEGNICVEELSKNRKGYEDFCYKLGIAYFYCYEDAGNKQLAERWLGIASMSHTIPARQKLRAERLYNICVYYSKVGRESKSGDIGASYLKYWEDLCKSAEGDILDTDNLTTALYIYNELASQISINALYFYLDGVSVTNMKDKLDEIEKAVLAWAQAQPGESIISDREKELLESLDDSITTARKVLNNLERKKTG